MKKQIALVRHGEAEQGFGIDSDLERELTVLGVSKLHRLAGVLKERDVFFDLLVTSPAKRTLQTVEILSQYVKIILEEQKRNFYLANCEVLFSAINQLSDQHQRVMLVGHNPGISALLAYLTDDFYVSLSPGMMALVDFEIDQWGAVSRGSGTLVEILQ